MVPRRAASALPSCLCSSATCPSTAALPARRHVQSQPLHSMVKKLAWARPTHLYASSSACRMRHSWAKAVARSSANLGHNTGWEERMGYCRRHTEESASRCHREVLGHQAAPFDPVPLVDGLRQLHSTTARPPTGSNSSDHECQRSPLSPPTPRLLACSAPRAAPPTPATAALPPPVPAAPPLLLQPPRSTQTQWCMRRSVAPAPAALRRAPWAPDRWRQRAPQLPSHDCAPGWPGAGRLCPASLLRRPGRQRPPAAAFAACTGHCGPLRSLGFTFKLCKRHEERTCPRFVEPAACRSPA